MVSGFIRLGGLGLEIPNCLLLYPKYPLLGTARALFGESWAVLKNSRVWELYLSRRKYPCTLKPKPPKP